MIRVIIKGTREEADTALRECGIWAGSRYDGRFLSTEQTYFLPDDALMRVQEWYKATGNFLDTGLNVPGALLWYAGE